MLETLQFNLPQITNQKLGHCDLFYQFCRSS